MAFQPHTVKKLRTNESETISLVREKLKCLYFDRKILLEPEARKRQTEDTIRR